jgi:hypothetical protein
MVVDPAVDYDPVTGIVDTKECVGMWEFAKSE